MYSLLSVALVAAPFLIASYYVGELSFRLSGSLAGLSLMVLAGYAGLISIGHAAFLDRRLCACSLPDSLREGAVSAIDALGGRGRSSSWGSSSVLGVIRMRGSICHRDVYQCHRARGVCTMGSAHRRVSAALPCPSRSSSDGASGVKLFTILACRFRCIGDREFVARADGACLDRNS